MEDAPQRRFRKLAGDEEVMRHSSERVRGCQGEGVKENSPIHPLTHPPSHLITTEAAARACRSRPCRRFAPRGRAPCPGGPCASRRNNPPAPKRTAGSPAAAHSPCPSC